DDGRGAADVEEGAVELPVRALEDAEARDFAGEPSGGDFIVGLGDTEQDAEARVDRTARRHPGARDALHDGAQPRLVELADSGRVVAACGLHRTRELVVAVRLGLAALLLEYPSERIVRVVV